MKLHIISSKKTSLFMSSLIENSTYNIETIYVDCIDEKINLKNKKLLFPIELDEIGTCNHTLNIIRDLYKISPRALEGSCAGLIIKSNSDLYTKNCARDIIFLLNNLGCSFMGHPLVEITKNYKNLLTFQKKYKVPLDDLPLILSKNMIKRLMIFNPQTIKEPNILGLHSSNYSTSNTLTLWGLIKNHLGTCSSEFHLENGTILDCKGCDFKTCKHHGLQTSCFYGGPMVRELYPSIELANSIVFLCPNYNDALSANISAVINRLTALYRKNKFYHKSVFALIVSGNSGSDIVAKQLISALNLNKGFRLPPYFALMYTANDPSSILNYKNIHSSAQKFAKHLLCESKA